MLKTDSLLRLLLREQLMSEDIYDTGYDPDVYLDDESKIREFEGTTPVINTSHDEVVRKAAKITGVNYYVVTNGKIDKGDASFPDFPNATLIANRFAETLKNIAKEYTPISIGYGKFPNIDTDDIGDDDTDSALLQFAKAIETSSLPKIKTLFAKALQVTKGDRVGAAAICYVTVKRIPVIIGVPLFTRTGTKLDIPGDAMVRFNTRKLEVEGWNVQLVIEDPDDSTIAFCQLHRPVGFLAMDDMRDIAIPVVFMNADNINRTTESSIEHEIGHGIDGIFGTACLQYDVTGNKKKYEDKNDYIGEANMPVISMLAPAPIPASGKPTQPDGTSSPNASQLLKSAADFLASIPELIQVNVPSKPKQVKTRADIKAKENYDDSMRVYSMRAYTAARFGFQVLGSLTGRDYSGVGRAFGAYQQPYGSDVSLVSDSWFELPGEQRNAVKLIYRTHSELKKTDKEYNTVPDARRKLVYAVRSKDQKAAEWSLAAFILATLGPHPASDFDKLAGFAAVDKQTTTGDTMPGLPGSRSGALPGETASGVSERWGRLAGLVD
jgi:hypothetical protein